MPDSAISRSGLRRWLGVLNPPLRILAEDVLAERTPIDIVAADPEGGIHIVLAGGNDDGANLLTRGLAHRSWVAARARDWMKLAPGLGLRPDQAIRCWLACPRFDPETVSAARSLGPGQISLAVVRGGSGAADEALTVEIIGLESPPAPVPADVQTPAQAQTPAPERAPDSARLPIPTEAAPRDERTPEPGPFRSGLRESDLALTAAERAEFD